MADDDGRFVATDQAILGYVYPIDTDVTTGKLRRWVGELTSVRPGEDHPMVVLYQVNGVPYGYFPKYRKHQRINRPQDSTLPGPPPDALFET